MDMIILFTYKRMSNIFVWKANVIFHKKSDFQLQLSVGKWFANTNLNFIRNSHICCVYLCVTNENVCPFLSIADVLKRILPFLVSKLIVCCSEGF
jgi:hypothetical protein